MKSVTVLAASPQNWANESCDTVKQANEVAINQDDFPNIDKLLF
jgi:hypothetical protein